MSKYVSYLRVSTKEQGKSGLGLEAQRAIIAHYTDADGAELVREFLETESGKELENRPILQEAVRYCIQHNAVLVVAKLDRLSRDVEHIFRLMKVLGSRFKSCDLPTTDSLTLSIFAGLAQREREIISIRTRQALQAKKAKGETLGKLENLTQEGRNKGANKVRQTAQENQQNVQASAVIKMYREQGKTFQDIAQQLNTSQFRTVRGKIFSKAMVRYLWLKD